jgi:hypothetical protein
LGCRKRKTKRKCKFDKDESPDGIIPPVNFVGKEDIGLFFFPQYQGQPLPFSTS